MKHIIFNKWSKKSLVALIACAVMYGWYAFKKIEPTLFPVVSSFSITKAEIKDGSLRIYGTMQKSRDCEFIPRLTTVYDNSDKVERLLNLKFTETPSGAVSREVGFQAWGYWVITPASRSITITATHECSTGRVKTVLFKGII